MIEKQTSKGHRLLFRMKPADCDMEKQTEDGGGGRCIPQNEKWSFFVVIGDDCKKGVLRKISKKHESVIRTSAQREIKPTWALAERSREGWPKIQFTWKTACSNLWRTTAEGYPIPRPT